MISIKDIDLSGKRVFVRVDFNVPINANGEVADDTRIRAALPTLAYILEHHGKVIVASHLGRPKGEIVKEFSLAPVAGRLSELLGIPVQMAPDCVGPEIANRVNGMNPGDVLLLENLRFHPEEQKNEASFAEALGSLCDVYVNDAFAVSHRANASVVAITQTVQICAAGLLLKRELDYITKAMDQPQRPLIAVVGGVKISSKLTAIENMLRHVDKLLIGGAMANTFFLGLGYPVGQSRVEPEMVDVTLKVAKDAKDSDIRLYLPVDTVVAESIQDDVETHVVPVQEIQDAHMALDIGPATVELFKAAMHDAGTIIWNGPMGVFEVEAFSRGTRGIAELLAESSALTIVGGGDTDAAIHQAGVFDAIDYISTGGGAFLALLEGKSLPAVDALQSCGEPEA